MVIRASKSAASVAPQSHESTHHVGGRPSVLALPSAPRSEASTKGHYSKDVTEKHGDNTEFDNVRAEGLPVAAGFDRSSSVALLPLMERAVSDAFRPINMAIRVPAFVPVPVTVVAGHVFSFRKVKEAQVQLCVHQAPIQRRDNSVRPKRDNVVCLYHALPVILLVKHTEKFASNEPPRTTMWGPTGVMTADMRLEQLLFDVTGPSSQRSTTHVAIHSCTANRSTAAEK